ncbi:MAG: hypothetical protein ACI8WB_002631 [Phenylobacterium sp.]|jgi:hypothetical protein
MEIILVLITIFLIIIALIASRFIDNSNPYPFAKKQTLYSAPERAFYQLLEKAVGDEYKIMTRVKLIDIVETKDATPSKNRRAALMKANAKSVDFVLCDKKTLAISGAIDLINNSSKDGHRAKADWFVNGALEAASIPHIRIKIKAGYRVEDIRNCVMFKLGKGKTETSQPLVKGTIGRPPRSPLAGLPTGLPTGMRTPAMAQA